MRRRGRDTQSGSAGCLLCWLPIAQGIPSLGSMPQHILNRREKCYLVGKIS